MNSIRILPDVDIPGAGTGTGLLTSKQGNFPLVAMTVAADITGLTAALSIRQTFRNPHECPLEATYIFPLPDRAAVTGFDVILGDRRITGAIKERQAARDAYDEALAAGQRAAIVEEDRPDVFTTRVGNLGPGEIATVELTLAGPVPCEFGEATFRVPLVVAPRYIPGQPLEGMGVGEGWALDTDAVPDASRITPPVLLPGSPNPVRLQVAVRLDPAGLAACDLRSSLHAATVAGSLPGPVTVELRPGERLDRDFILRYRVADDRQTTMTAVATPDADSDEGTIVVTLLPPAAVTAAARDVVLLVDRSGSMGGWKMVAARRAAARIIDSLTSVDRFGILAFDHDVERPPGLPAHALVEATDRNRFRAVEWLSGLEARGGTELATALSTAQKMLTPSPSDAGDRSAPLARRRAAILVTDGQVGNEDQLVRLAGALASDAGTRLFCVGIDRAVNAGLLRRLAATTGGRCDLVESEDRLDDVVGDLHRRISHPLVEAVTVSFDALAVDSDTVTPRRPSDLYPGVPLVLSARFRGPAGGRVTAMGADGKAWSCDVAARGAPTPSAVSAVWARGHLRDLEDRYLTQRGAAPGSHDDLARHIVSVSLRHRVLCRFTAWVAVDDSGEVVTRSRRHIVQPVEMPSGWRAGAATSTFRAVPASARAGLLGAEIQPAVPMAAYNVDGPSVPTGPPERPRLSASGRGLPTTAPVAGHRNGPPPAQLLPSGGAAPLAGAAQAALAAYRPRLEALLAAVERLGDPPDPIAAAGLATVARLLASDLASVFDRVLVAEALDALEALAIALDADEPGVVGPSAARLRSTTSGSAGEQLPSAAVS